MLSIVIYGRNDSHGYNLHKRVALSINCMAEILDCPDDEIIFVDYNTPDDLPTFPEAIHDTLTAAARRRLRVLRVRARHHSPLRPLTHLPVLEPVARNAAIRRANPANGWILSTNSDMIFVPRKNGASLSEMAAGLEPACHHLPRFDLPEMLWESFDRLAPAAAIAALREGGPGLHLDETVYGSPPALYDNHGDFQLIPRAALEAINGFDERMRSGWIVDSNMARRLMLRLGPPKSLASVLAGYHCDHTRVPGQFHAHSHVENDYRRFYLEVERPDLPQQAATWGLAGETLEEFRLSEAPAAAALRTLQDILPPPEAPPAEVTYSPDVFDLAHYPAEHVLPFLCNLLQQQERRASVAWFGARPRMQALFARLWRGLGFQGRMLTPMNAEEMEAAILSADLFVFEFGAASQDETPHRQAGWHDDDMERLTPVRDALLSLAAEEGRRIAAGSLPRLVITINAVHNRFEALVHDSLSVSRAPFSTRLRHGHVLAEPPPAAETQLTPPALARWLGRRLNRRQEMPVTEAVRLLSYAEEMVTTPPHGPRFSLMLQAASCLDAVLDYPAFTRHWPADAVAEARRRIAAERASRRLASRAWIPIAPTLPPAAAYPGRLATVEDWEDDGWITLARRFFMGAFAANTLNRSAAQWVRIHVLDQVKRRARLAEGTRVLVVAAGAEPLADVLSCLGALVHVRGPVAPATAFRVPSRLTFVSDNAPAIYDAVILTPGSTFIHGDLNRGAEALSSAIAALASGGLLAIAEEGDMGHPRPDRFSAALPFSKPFIAALGRQGLSPLAMAPCALTSMTLDHAAPGAGEIATPHFVKVDGGNLRLTGAWFFIKTGPGGDARTLEGDLRHAAAALCEESRS